MALTESQLKQAQIDFDRAKALKEQGVVSIEQYDQANTALRIAIADQALAKHQLTQAEAALGSSNEDHSRYARPVVKQAEAALEAAKLDLDYTRLTAPFAGIVTHKTAHVGNRVQVGEPLLAVVPLGGLYLTANFKETQLTDVRVGQKVEFVADIIPITPTRDASIRSAWAPGCLLAVAARERNRQLGQGRAARAGQDCSRRAGARRQTAAAGTVGEVAIDLADRSGPLLTSIVQQHFQKDGQTLPNETLKMAPRTPAEPQPGTAPQQNYLHSQLLPP